MYTGQSEDNWFNKRYRSKIAQNPVVRSVFYLHWDGDAASDYLSSDKFSSLKIEIDRYDECMISDDMLDDIEAELNRIIEKPNGIIFEESDIFSLANSEYSIEEVLAIKERYQYKSSSGSEAVIHFLCLNKYADDPSNIGLTLMEDGLVIFWQKIKELSSNNPDSLKLFVVSTVLHEIGHQVGIGHVEDESCLMAAFVERPGNARGALKNIPTSFCQGELDTVEQIRESL
ncbi:MAG: matrixin family metalloprotease [Candidatus Marinimicrobia bacterium]|nr:matrixin family metalloprotease [Candidatus Neomarinimicrobiota bacterium]